jgi:multiple sugar transport system substrate-binding protein
MRITKLGAAAVAVVLTTVSLGACSAASDDGPVTISFWHAFNADSSEVTVLEDTLIPAFEEAHPDITVEQVAVPYDELHQKLITAVAGGTLPDVVRADIIWVPELADLGVAAPLEELMSDFDEIAGSVYPGALATAEWDGQHYGLPLSTNTRVYLSNPDTYAEAGLAVPQTQDEVADVAAAFAADGVYAFADNDLSGWNILPWIWSAGGDLLSPDLSTAEGYINGPESLAAIQLLYELYSEGGIPPILVQGGQDGTEDGLASGSYASEMNGPWAYPIIAGSFPDVTLAASQVPSGAGGSVSVVGGEDVVVAAASEHKDAAAEWVRYLLSPEAQRALAEVGQMSVLSDLGPEMVGIQPYYEQFVEQLATARPRPATPAWPEIDQAMKTRLQAAFIEGDDLQTALDELAAQIDDILASH